jgi:hypothetical protein
MMNLMTMDVMIRSSAAEKFIQKDWASGVWSRAPNDLSRDKAGSSWFLLVVAPLFRTNPDDSRLPIPRIDRVKRASGPDGLNIKASGSRELPLWDTLTASHLPEHSFARLPYFWWY